MSVKPPSSTHADVPNLEGDQAHLTDFLAPAQAGDEIGRLGPYRVLKVLGHGGMGVVFLAEDIQLQRRVALKVMLPTLAASESARQRFIREARAAAAIEHDHIVPIFQVGEDRGIPFLAMPFLQGEPLDVRLVRERLLPLPEVLRIGREIAEGLQAAHERGLVHRDIKPGNVWLEGDRRRVKILDFGLARSAADESHLTQQGAIVGTPSYMAPEQATGGRVDQRCDLFSLGCILYRLATGELPFQGTDAIATLLAVSTEQPPSPQVRNPRVPRPLSDLIMRLLEKDPAKRPANAQKVVQALQQIDADPSVQLQAVTPRREPQKRRGVALLAGALAVLLLLGGTAVWWFLSGGSPTSPATSSPGPVASAPATAKPSPPLAPDPSGQPLSALAFAAAPTPIPGLRSWSVETKPHRGPIYLAAFRPDSKRIATAGADGSVRIWDPASQDLLKVLLGPAATVHVIAWSRDGKNIAAAGDDLAVHVWDADTGRLLHSLPGHTGIVRALAWSADGKRLASASNDRTVRLWDIETGKAGRVFSRHDHVVTFVAWRPDGKLVSMQGEGHEQRRAWVWQDAAVTEGKSYDFIGPAAWSPDHNVLVCRDGDAPAVQFWNIDTGKVERKLPLKEQGAIIGILAWTADGKKLATADGAVVRFWDVATGKLLQTTVAPHRNGIATLAWAPDGSHAVSTSTYDSAVSLWNPTEKDPVRRMVGAINFAWASWAPDSKMVFGGNGAQLLVWEAATGKTLLNAPVIDHGWGGSDTAWSPDGKALASAGAALGRVAVWDTATGALLRGLPRHSPKLVGWSPDGTRLAGHDASGGYDLHVWDYPSDKRLTTLLGHTNWAHGFVWSPDSKRLATAAIDGTTRLWSAEGGKALRVHGGCDMRTATFSQDGKRFFQGAGDTLLVCDSEGTADPKPFFKTDGVLTTVVLSPDGTTLACGDTNGAIKLCAADTGAAGLVIARAHTGPVHRLSWLPDGKQLASLGETDRSVCTWDAATGKRLGRATGILGHGRFSPDGRLLAINGDPPGVRIWDTATGRVRAVLLLFPGQPDRYLSVAASGHYRGSPGIEQEMVYVADTGTGVELLEADAFAQRFQWKNDPEKVRLTDR
jgi:WD40 repeat protein